MPAFTVLEAGTAKEFSASDKVVVLGFFKSDSDQGFKSFTEVAKMVFFFFFFFFFFYFFFFHKNYLFNIIFKNF